jgi:hypothetical protein
MRINFITPQPNAACSQFYSDALSKLEQVTLHDSNLTNYDVILLMTYDHYAIDTIRHSNSKAKIGIIDPRNHTVIESAKKSDFLIKDSIEMQDYWSIAKKPMFRYIEYPNIGKINKIHKKNDRIKIGYHGNLVHLDCMQDSVTPALAELANEYDIELVVMYNGNSPSGNEAWLPKNVVVTHIPWSMNAYVEELSQCDIGIVPNNILQNIDHTAVQVKKSYNYSIDDYSIRFKMPSNPGRFVIFGLLGIPVVTDFYPSALQYINEEHKTGMVACNAAGWFRCLKMLIESHKLRQEMGDNLQRLVEDKFDFNIQNQKLLSFLSTL